MTRIRLGIAGLGIMGRMYADAVTRSPLAEVAAVVTRSDEGRRFARQTWGCPAFDTPAEMYRAGGIDAAIITLPDFLHCEAVVGAAKAGLHLLVEKPFATRVRDADRMVEAIDRAGVKCMVEFFNRWSPPFVEAKKAVDRGDLGEIVSLTLELNDTIWVPTRMLSWAAATTPGWFLMSHTADLAAWITGKTPAAVYARGVKNVLVKRGIDTYDLIEALVEYTDGALGRFTSCWVLPEGMPIVYELKMRLVGSEAAVDVDTSDQQVHLITPQRLTHPVTAWGDIQGSLSGHPYRMLADFIDNIACDTEPLVGPRAGWENTLFLEAVHRSVETGERIAIH